MELVKLEVKALERMTKGSLEDLIELDKEELLKGNVKIGVGTYQDDKEKAFMITKNNIPVFYVSYHVLRKWILLNQYPNSIMYKHNLKKELGLT